MVYTSRFSKLCGFTAAIAASMAVFGEQAAADSCTKLSSLALPEVVSITATSVAAGGFTPPGLATPVSVDFCRIQITVAPAINIEVWLPPPGNWNHRFQGEGGGGYAGVISYSALAMAVTGDAVTGQFATASTIPGILQAARPTAKAAPTAPKPAAALRSTLPTTCLMRG